MRIFIELMLPMSVPIIIVAGDHAGYRHLERLILGLSRRTENLPMTVQLNNVINTTTGERLYNVNMAATILTIAGPAYHLSVFSRWFRARHRRRLSQRLNHGTCID